MWIFASKLIYNDVLKYQFAVLVLVLCFFVRPLDSSSEVSSQNTFQIKHLDEAYINIMRCLMFKPFQL